jgi:hypothetical protein
MKKYILLILWFMMNIMISSEIYSKILNDIIKKDSSSEISFRFGIKIEPFLAFSTINNNDHIKFSYDSYYLSFGLEFNEKNIIEFCPGFMCVFGPGSPLPGYESIELCFNYKSLIKKNIYLKASIVTHFYAPPSMSTSSSEEMNSILIGGGAGFIFSRNISADVYFLQSLNPNVLFGNGSVYGLLKASLNFTL